MKLRGATEECQAPDNDGEELWDSCGAMILFWVIFSLHFTYFYLKIIL